MAEQSEQNLTPEQFRLLFMVMKFNACYPTEQELKQNPALRQRLEIKFKEVRLGLYLRNSKGMVEIALVRSLNKEKLMDLEVIDLDGKMISVGNAIKNYGFGSDEIKEILRQTLIKSLPNLEKKLDESFCLTSRRVEIIGMKMVHAIAICRFSAEIAEERKKAHV